MPKPTLGPLYDLAVRKPQKILGDIKKPGVCPKPPGRSMPALHPQEEISAVCHQFSAVLELEISIFYVVCQKYKLIGKLMPVANSDLVGS